MKKLKKIYIEITNICNLSCDFCPGSGRQEMFMKRELFERILGQVKDFTGQIYFHVMGEPLLHPEIGVFLDICRDYGLKVNLTTNGTLLEKNAEILLAKPALRQVNFSLHSFEVNYRNYSIDSYLDKIFDFINKSSQREKLLIGLRLWNIADDAKNSFNRHILDRIQKNFDISGVIEPDVTPVNGLKLSENVFLHIAEVFDWPDAAIEDISSRGFCYGLRDQAAILVDGTVVPCCLDGHGVINLGNIMEENFEDIINGERARSIYDGFSRRQAVEPLCRKCGYRKRFDCRNG